MKIYDFEGFPNPARVRIALAEKGLTGRVQFVTVDVPGGEHKTPAFMAKNPAAAVPVLELDDGTTIAECTAITEYLDHLTGEPALTGRTARERAVIHMMQRRSEAGLLDAVATYFHHATPGLGPNIETYQCAEWGNHQKGRAVQGMTYLELRVGQPALCRRRQFLDSGHHCVCRPRFRRHRQNRHTCRMRQPEGMAREGSSASQHRQLKVKRVQWNSTQTSMSA